MTAIDIKRTVGRLDVNLAHAPSGDVVTLRGQLDDQATLLDLVGQIKSPAAIDLGGVRFINSVGVREWILFLAALADANVKVSLRNCSEPMVHQMNMVMEAGSGAAIESFFAPYSCSSCGGEQSIQLVVAPILDQLRAGKVPPQPCPDCSATMQFDDFPSRYLLFLG